MQQADKKLVLERNEGEKKNSAKWLIKEPENFPASESAITSLIGALNTIRVKEYYDGEAGAAEKFNLTNPEGTVTVEFKNELKRSPLKVNIASAESDEANQEQKKDGAYISTSLSPTVFGLEKNPASDLFKPAAFYREKNFFKFDTWRAREVNITPKGGEPVRMVNKNGDYEVNGKAAKPSESWNLLAALSGLEATDFPKETRNFGFDDPLLKVVVKVGTEDNKADSGAQKQEKLEEHILVVGEGAVRDEKGEPTSYFAAVGDLALPFIISKESFDKINLKASSLAEEPSATPAAK